MPGTNPPEIVIDRRALNAVLAAAFLVTWLPAGGFVVWVFVGDFARDPSLFEGAKLAATLGVIAGIGGFAVYYCLCRSVGRARFGATVVFDTFVHRRQIAWEEIGRLVLKEKATPLPTACVLKFVLTDGTRLEVFASREQAEAVFRLAHTRPWARHWPGRPLWPGTVGAIFGLGLVAVLVGAWIDVLLVVAFAQRGVDALAAPGPQPRTGQLLAVALGLPLVGLAAVAFALYHLVGRPVVIRAGLVRIREGEASSRREMLENLFGTQE